MSSNGIIQNKMDCHTHSSYSPDALNTVEEMCIRAIEAGLETMAITDHCECNRFYPKDNYTPTEPGTYDNKTLREKSLSEITRCRELFENKLNLLCGIELGQPTFDITSAEEAICDDRLDYVIGSMHQVPGQMDFCFMNIPQYNIPKLMEAYFLEIIRMCRWNGFDSLGHLTYPLRYIEGMYGIPVDMDSCEEPVREIFRLLAANGKALEVNSSGLRQKYGKPFPTLKYLKLYRELGGEMLTFGSDAHRADHLAYGLEDMIRLAGEAGFRYAFHFRARKPVGINLS
jgi:histidinol-phosphatase (PHP family)